MKVDHPGTPAYRIAFLAGVCLIFLQAYRVPVIVIGPGLDRSFPHVLNLFAHTSMRFGTDLVYTYGPLGFLLRIENVRDNLVVGFVFWTALYLLFSIALTHFVLSGTVGLRRAFAFLLAVSVAGFIDEERLITCLVMVLLLIAFDHQRQRTKILASCCALSSIALLIKFPVGVACAGMILCSAVWPLEYRSIARNLVLVALSITVSLGVLWWLDNGSLLGLAAYVRNSLELTSGYSANMSSPRLDENRSLVAFLLALAALVAMILLLPKASRPRTLLVMLFPLFVSWKSGVVRFDIHILALVSMAMCVGLLLCVLHLKRETTVVDARSGPRLPGRSNARQVAALVLFLVACGALNRGLVDTKLSTGDVRYPLLSRAFQEQIGGVADHWLPGSIPLANAVNFSAYQGRLDALAATNLAEARLDDSLSNRIGRKTIDIYSYELGFLAANPGLNYRPKPIFQHFNAFTRRLDQLNATFFASPRRPEFLLMHDPKSEMESVDGRHPLFDDPIAFLTIMNAYRPVFVEEDVTKPRVALLQHDGEGPGRFGTPVAFKEERVGWNQTIRVPTVDETSVLRARIDLGKNALSTLKEAVFRLSPMYLNYLLADGTKRRWRLVPPHLSSGVWISPLFEDYEHLYAFLGGRSWRGPKVVAIRFEADDPRDYPAAFTMVWEKIACTGACGAVEGRVFSGAAGTVPVPIESALLGQVTSAVGSITAVEVRLSTYAKINQGTLTLQILDPQGAVLREARADAASVLDNRYQLFSFAPLTGIEGVPLTVRLTYAPEKNGMLAAWRTSPTAPGFDFRVYGH